VLTIAELTMINSRLLHIFFVETGAAGITRRHTLIELSRADAQPWSAEQSQAQKGVDEC